ncbi:MAG: ribonuclease HI, partial [Desulfobulbaceae bacterium]|nr:ribonuclease HI [Desulfobulbaceae bacterium]
MPLGDILKVTVYTDGACSPNPGPGGWGAILLYDGRDPQELIGWESGATTNNRMELRAALEALQTLSGPHHVQLFTDSKYLRNGITRWLSIWEKRNWQTKENTDVKNQDLWRQLA